MAMSHLAGNDFPVPKLLTTKTIMSKLATPSPYMQGLEISRQKSLESCLHPLHQVDVLLRGQVTPAHHRDSRRPLGTAAGPIGTHLHSSTRLPAGRAFLAQQVPRCKTKS